MANKEKEEVKKKSTLVHDTICLFMITLISGLLLGAGYTITKKPIAAQEEKNKQEAYEAVYQGASFEEDSALNKSLEKFNKDLAAGKVSSIESKGRWKRCRLCCFLQRQGLRWSSKYCTWY